MRWFPRQVQLLAQHGVRVRFKALLAKILRKGVALASARPWLKSAVVRFAQALGMVAVLRRLYMKSRVFPFQGHLPPLTQLEIGSRARQIHDDLEHAIEQQQAIDSAR